jgi:hypothetical protein
MYLSCMRLRARNLEMISFASAGSDSRALLCHAVISSASVRTMRVCVYVRVCVCVCVVYVCVVVSVVARRHLLRVCWLPPPQGGDVGVYV